MRSRDVLDGISRLGLDTTPIIYFVERNLEFYKRSVLFL